jgi:UDPglucose 6-dehydrogenase
MKLGVIGTGYVGLVTGTCLAEIGHEVLCIDSDEEKIRTLEQDRIPIFEPGLEELVRKNRLAGRLRFSCSVHEAVAYAGVIFIAVSTPSRPDGSADLSSVEKVARDVASCMTEYRVLVDKSTVPVNTGEKVAETIKRYHATGVEFDVVSNPEFLREGSAVRDFLEPDRIVIGVSSGRAADIMKDVYAPLDKPLIVTNIKSAEIIKHASNSFLAMKISFINSVARICDRCGADIQEVALGMGLDPRIGSRFLNAGLGYGGSCFPKDVSAFVKIAENLGYSFDLLKAVEQVNREQIRYFLKKIEDVFWVLKGKKIAVWGLAFKPDTDDMRSAPVIPVIRALVEEGAEITAFDPKSMEKARRDLPEIAYAEDPYSMLEGRDGLIIATEWRCFVDADLEKVRKALATPIVIDGRNLFDPETMKRLGFEYVSIGRPAGRETP